MIGLSFIIHMGGDPNFQRPILGPPRTKTILASRNSFVASFLKRYHYIINKKQGVQYHPFANKYFKKAKALLNMAVKQEPNDFHFGADECLIEQAK